MTAWIPELLEQIDRRGAKVGVIGLGYVGLPLALRAVDAGFEVTGVERDSTRLRRLRVADPELADVDHDALRHGLESGRLELTDDPAAVASFDIVLICVPTPLVAGAPDLSFVLAAADSIARHLRPGTLVSLESTTYPGTTEELVRPRLEEGGLDAERDFALVFSPERLDPGNARYGIAEIPKIVGGLTPEAARLAERFYSAIVSKVVVVARPREAELAKVLENTYRHVNVALINEFAMVANELGIDIWETIEAASTKPFGFQPFYPGPGVGGHCIPVDPIYLTWRIRELGRTPFRMVELAREIDELMPTYVARRIVDRLATAGVPPTSAKVFALGVTYKPDVADTRESRALEVLVRLIELGVDVSWHDPFHDVLILRNEVVRRTEVEAGVRQSDLVAVLTHHSSYDWRDIVSQANLVFDARGVTVGMIDPKITRL